MLDVQQLIIDTLVSKWDIDNPSVVEHMFRKDEFDPKWEVPVKTLANPSVDLVGNIQIVLENFPDRKIYLCKTDDGNCYKIEHSCRITIHLKPISYIADKIDDYKTMFFNIKSEIDRILTLMKFDISGISNLELSLQGWNDRMTVAVGRGTKQRKEPIVWKSEKTVTAHYYIYGSGV